MNRLKQLFRQVPILASREAYQRWAASYPPHAHNPFMQLEETTLGAMLPSLAGKRVLDLACGTGRWGGYALRAGAAQVMSFDDSHAMLLTGRPSFASEASMSAIPLGAGSVDVVLCGLAVGHIPSDAMHRTLAEMGRVLAADGVALVSDVHPLQAWRGAKRTFEANGKTFAVEHHIHTYADYFSAARDAGLKISDVREVGIKEGEPPVLLALKFEAI